VVPGALADQLLERLLGVFAREVRRAGDAPGDGLDALALAVEQQAVEVRADPPRRLGLWEVRREPRRVPAQAIENRRIEVGK